MKRAKAHENEKIVPFGFTLVIGKEPLDIKVGIGPNEVIQYLQKASLASIIRAIPGILFIVSHELVVVLLVY